MMIHGGGGWRAPVTLHFSCGCAGGDDKGGRRVIHPRPPTRVLSSPPSIPSPTCVLPLPPGNSLNDGGSMGHDGCVHGHVPWPRFFSPGARSTVSHTRCATALAPSLVVMPHDHRSLCPVGRSEFPWRLPTESRHTGKPCAFEKRRCPSPTLAIYDGLSCDAWRMMDLQPHDGRCDDSRAVGGRPPLAVTAGTRHICPCYFYLPSLTPRWPRSGRLHRRLE